MYKQNPYNVARQIFIAMESITFTQNGYHYFLVPKEDGYYWLMSDADFALQSLRASEQKGVIVSVTKDQTQLLSLGQVLEKKTITEILRVENQNSAFKVRLE